MSHIPTSIASVAASLSPGAPWLTSWGACRLSLTRLGQSRALSASGPTKSGPQAGRRKRPSSPFSAPTAWTRQHGDSPRSAAPLSGGLVFTSSQSWSHERPTQRDRALQRGRGGWTGSVQPSHEQQQDAYPLFLTSFLLRLSASKSLSRLTFSVPKVPLFSRTMPSFAATSRPSRYLSP